MKKYILSVMLVILTCIQCWAGSHGRWCEESTYYPKSIYSDSTRLGTSTASDYCAEFAREHDLDMLYCVHCDKRGGLHVDGVALHCTKCSWLSLVSEYDAPYSCIPPSKFYEGQKVWDVLIGRGTVKKVDRSRDDSMAIAVEMDDRSLGYGSLGYRWYSINGTYDIKDKTKRLYAATTKIATFDLDKLFPEKKQERLLVRELVGTETVGFRLSDWTSSYRCVICGESLTTVCNSNVIWYCSKCQKYFNIEKGE